jgi:L-cysteine S-thiosulfotransferase
MGRYLKGLAAVLVFGALAGCGGRHSAAGFRLPENGDVGRGKAAFVELKCSNCHTVANVDLPAPTSLGMPVPLGGTVHEVRTDGYLVTSIIHPSHVVAQPPRTALLAPAPESHMPDFSRDMTVRQLVDLVAFLQSTYKVVPPPYNTP